jgi:hypothetical protein
LRWISQQRNDLASRFTLINPTNLFIEIVRGYASRYYSVMKRTRRMLFALATLAALAAMHLIASPAFAQEKRKVIIDQDCSGPGGSNMQSVLALLKSPGTDVLGIAVVTGDQWRDEEVAHMLRRLQTIWRRAAHRRPCPNNSAEKSDVGKQQRGANWPARARPEVARNSSDACARSGRAYRS